MLDLEKWPYRKGMIVRFSRPGHPWNNTQWTVVGLHQCGEDPETAGDDPWVPCEFIGDIRSTGTTGHECLNRAKKFHGWNHDPRTLEIISPPEPAIDALELAWSDLVDQADEDPTEYDREFFVAGWHAAMRQKR